ncbi:reverse transcriptase domain-containing protein [Tanacetum coccineum]
MPNNVKTYDGTGDPKDHLKIFQAAIQMEHWAMPTWCHMFNSTLIGAARVWFDELPPESIDGYKGLKAAFLAYFMQQKKYVKDPVEIHNIKQRDGETIEDFIEHFKVETGRIKGAPECMQIFGFIHGVNNPELTKRLNEHVPKTMEEMMTITTAFIRGEAAAASKKKDLTEYLINRAAHRSIPGRETCLIREKKRDRSSGRDVLGIPFQICGKVLAAIQNLEEVHQKSDFCWTQEAKQAFKQLKQLLSELPLLVAPKLKDELIVYLTASYGAVSAVLITKRDTDQMPIYFISHTLQGLELNYTLMEKLVLSLVFAAKRLRRYFQAHPIAVITDQPIKQIMSRPDVAGRLQKWSVMLGEHNITYRLRASVKGQILTDFLVEKPDENPPNTPVVTTPPEP